MKGALLTKVGDELVLDLSTCSRGSEFNDTLQKVKAFEARRFDWDTKLWHFPDEPMIADRILRTINIEADDELLEWIRSSRKRAEEEVTTPLPPDGEVLVPWGDKRMPWQPKMVNDLEFKGLFDFQRSAVAHIAREKRAILADDMGLGKTIQAISVVEEYRRRNPNIDGTLPDGPKLIIAPKSVKGAWVRELGRWLEPDTYAVQMIDAATPKKRFDQIVSGIKDDAWLIGNWEMLRTEHVKIKINHRSGMTSWEPRIKLKEPLFQVPWAAYMDLPYGELDPRMVDRLKAKKDKVKAGKWLAVLADEIHRAKNKSAKQTKGLHRIDGELMVGMTGTPVMNAPSELWSLLHWLWPYEFSSHENFEALYEDSYEENYSGHKGKVVLGVKNPDGLRYAIRGRVIRRTAGSVRSLPGHRRIYFDVPLHANQAKAYKDAEKEMWLRVEKEVDEGKASAIEFADKMMQGDLFAVTRIPNGGARTVQLRKILENLALVGGPDSSAMMDDFTDRVGDSRPEPWIGFFAFKESCHLMAARLRKAYPGIQVSIYTGETPAHERTRIEERFQQGNIDVIVGTTAALKEGITLTRANRGYFGSRDWVPATDDQAEHRYADRIGQARKSTTYIPQAPDTVAVTKVEPTNSLKRKIERAVIAKDEIEEVYE